MRVLEYLLGVKTHPNAETVYNHVKKELPTITLATVYRNLNAMVEAGQIIRMEINNEYHYDADTRAHQHCICRSCGKIIDVFQDIMSKYALSTFKSDEFIPSEVTIIFLGKCKNCTKEKEGNK